MLMCWQSTPKAVNIDHIIYVDAVITNCDTFQLFSNSDPYVIDTNATKKQITVNKIEHELAQKVHAVYDSRATTNLP